MAKSQSPSRWAIFNRHISRIRRLSGSFCRAVAGEAGRELFSNLVCSYILFTSIISSSLHHFPPLISNSSSSTPSTSPSSSPLSSSTAIDTNNLSTSPSTQARPSAREIRAIEPAQWIDPRVQPEDLLPQGIRGDHPRRNESLPWIVPRVSGPLRVEIGSEIGSQHHLRKIRVFRAVQCTHNFPNDDERNAPSSPWQTRRGVPERCPDLLQNDRGTSRPS